MSEESDYIFWESLISPGRSRRKTKSEARENGSKRKNDITFDVNDRIPKEKQSSTFKGVMQAKKDKKKKKKKKLLDLHSDAAAMAISKPDLSNLSGSAQKQKSHQLIQNSKEEGPRKKKVAFDLAHEYARVKRPTFSSAHPKFPKECTELKIAPIRDCERYSLVSEVTQYQSQLQENDIQWEDSNSQDLFITQKTFRSSSSDSCAEASYKAVTTVSQQTQTLHNSLDQIKYPDEDCRQRRRKKKQQRQTAKASNAEKDRLRIRKKKYCFQTEGEKDASSSFQSRTNRANLCMDETVVGDRSSKVAKSKQCHCEGIQRASSCSLHAALKPTACSSTQTENFFTAQVSSYLAFSRKRRLAACHDHVKPLDLSLPNRARKDLGRRSCVKVSASEVREDEKWRENQLSPFPKEVNAPPFCPSAMQDSEVKKGVAVSDKRKEESAPSPLTESESKSGDTTTFGDCNEPPCRSKKVEQNQVRPFQMRLNESFYFKTKGDGCSPRPESPLMTLVQGRASEKDVKGKKGR
ncbi:uncharacterized protein LOC133402650 [Phycodurus eques]|uniref:uncharacterized protein LOC133402650 n=1 Tax=Phycodurus eques TaxID=693459 RepID=UPI002ACDC768|nr:uncharacterized protein LOC133402650 [Phycodurus eques]